MRISKSVRKQQFGDGDAEKIILQWREKFKVEITIDIG